MAHLAAEVGLADYLRKLQMDDAGRYLREALADKPALILMDDVWEAQVCRAIAEALPVSSRLVVTTRNSQLVDCLGVPADQRLCIQGMNEQEGMTLCRHLAGQAWDENNEPLVRRVGQRVRWHPKALTLLVPMGQRIGWQALWASLNQAAESAQIQRELTWGEEIDLAFDTSYDNLGEQKAWIDALGKLDWCSSFDCELMAAAWDVDENIAIQRIGELVALHWVEQVQDDGWVGTRYALHWLAWNYARERARWKFGERTWGPAWAWRYKSDWLAEQLAWPRPTPVGRWRRLVQVVDLRHWPIPQRPGVKWYQDLHVSASRVMLRHWLRNGIEVPGEVYVLARRLDLRAKLIVMPLLLGVILVWVMVGLGVYGPTYTILVMLMILLAYMVLCHFAMALRFLEHYGPGQ